MALQVACGSPVEDVDDSNDWPTTGNVVELTSQGIDSQLSEGSWLLEFYAPWCGYCKRLEPVYEEVAKELKAGTSGVSVARIDGSKYKGVSARFMVQGFPTIFHVHRRQVRKYTGGRSKESLVQFATDGWIKTEPDFSQMLSPLGTLGRVLGAFLEFTVDMQKVYEEMRLYLDLSHPVALGIVALLTAVSGSILGLTFSFMFPEKPAVHNKRE